MNSSCASLYADLPVRSQWFSEQNQRIHAIPHEWRQWLQSRGSLTSALIEVSQDNFRVRVLSEYWRLPTTRESLKLSEPPHLAARIREVELLCNEQVMVFARSIIPLSVFQREPFTFQGMGSKPLGHVLFHNGRARIRQRDIAAYQSTPDSPILFGRATPYEYGGGEILVSEFFVNYDLISL